jgi:hypothetical protein
VYVKKIGRKNTVTNPRCGRATPPRIPRRRRDHGNARGKPAGEQDEREFKQREEQHELIFVRPGNGGWKVQFRPFRRRWK